MRNTAVAVAVACAVLSTSAWADEDEVIGMCGDDDFAGRDDSDDPDEDSDNPQDAHAQLTDEALEQMFERLVLEPEPSPLADVTEESAACELQLPEDRTACDGMADEDCVVAHAVCADPSTASRDTIVRPPLSTPVCAATCAAFEACTVHGTAVMSEYYRGVYTKWATDVDHPVYWSGVDPVQVADSANPPLGFTPVPSFDPVNCATPCPATSDPFYGVEAYRSPCETPSQVKARLQAVQNRWNKIVPTTPGGPMPDRLVFGHRGSTDFNLENTLEAIDATYRVGADGNEADIYPTTTGMFFMFHDNMPDVLTDMEGITGGHTWNEVDNTAFRMPDIFGAYSRIPTLFQYFAVERRHAGLMLLDHKEPRPALPSSQAIWYIESIAIALRMQTQIVNYFPGFLQTNHTVVGSTANGTGFANSFWGNYSFALDGDGYADQATIQTVINGPDPECGVGVCPMIETEDPRPVLRELGRAVGPPSCRAFFPARTFTYTGNESALLAQIAACANLQDPNQVTNRVGPIIPNWAAFTYWQNQGRPDLIPPQKYPPAGYPVNGVNWPAYSDAQEAAHGAQAEGCARAANLLGHIPINNYTRSMLQYYGWHQSSSRFFLYTDVDGVAAAGAAMRQSPTTPANFFVVPFLNAMSDRVAAPALDPFAFYTYQKFGWTASPTPNSITFRQGTHWRTRQMMWRQLNAMNPADGMAVAWHYLNQPPSQQLTYAVGTFEALRALTRIDHSAATLTALWNDGRMAYRSRAVLEAIDAAADGETWAVGWIQAHYPPALNWITVSRCDPNEVLPPAVNFTTANRAMATYWP